MLTMLPGSVQATLENPENYCKMKSMHHNAELFKDRKLSLLFFNFLVKLKKLYIFNNNLFVQKNA